FKSKKNEGPKATNVTQTINTTTVTTSATLPFPHSTLITHVHTRSIYIQLNPLFKSSSPIAFQPHAFNFVEAVPLLPFDLPPRLTARGVIELEDKLDGVLTEVQSKGYFLGIGLGETKVRNRYCVEREGEGARVTLKFEIVLCGKGM